MEESKKNRAISIWFGTDTLYDYHPLNEAVPGALSETLSLLSIRNLLSSFYFWQAEGRAGWRIGEAKHRELFTTQYPYVQKVADSYLLPMADLLRVSPHDPAPRPASEVPGSTGEQVNDTDPKSPPPTHETTEDTPFGTTT
ncbi:hypothetical protein Tco_0272997 [Tanacetum coccineum]